MKKPFLLVHFVTLVAKNANKYLYDKIMNINYFYLKGIKNTLVILYDFVTTQSKTFSAPSVDSNREAKFCY